MEIFTSQAATPVSTTPVANCHWCQQHWRQCQSTNTDVKFFHRNRWCLWYWWQCQRYQQKILSPVSMSLVANCHWYQWHRLQINIRLLTLKWPSRKIFFYMLTLLPEGVPTKELKLFWLKTFSSCHWWVPRWCTLSCKNLQEFMKKFEGPNGSRAWGETDRWKNLKSKILWYCLFLTYKKSEITYGAQTINPAWIISNKIMLCYNTMGYLEKILKHRTLNSFRSHTTCESEERVKGKSQNSSMVRQNLSVCVPSWVII